MPLRFRCVYCNQLLGISRRKSGSVVRCTNCDGQIIVPEEPADKSTPLPVPKEHVPIPGEVFERHDFDDLLRPFNFDDIPVSKEAPSPAPDPLENSVVQNSATPFCRSNYIRFGLIWAMTVIGAFVAGLMFGKI